MAPSVVYLIMLVSGGAIAVVGSTLYPIARANEQKVQLAKDAKSLLLPEIERNTALFEGLKDIMLNKGAVLDVNLETAAWEVVSRGSLVSGFKSEDLNKLIESYRYLYLFNERNSKLNSSLYDISSSLQNAGERRMSLFEQIKSLLPAIEKSLQEAKSAAAR